MKHIFTLFTVILIFSSCTVQNNIKKVEIKESGYNINIFYDPIDFEISMDGVSYRMKPISPDELNTFFIQENTYNGKFDYSHFETSRESYFLVKNRSQSKNEESSNWEFLIEGLNRLYENDEITQDNYFAMSDKISDYYSEEKAEQIVPDYDRYIYANPYYIGDKYLNVFQVEITNSTDSYSEFSGEFSVEVGDQLLTSLDENQIIELLVFNDLYNQFKHKNIERHHLKKSIKIPPNSSFIKYFATLPIDYNNKVLIASAPDINEKAYWDIIKEKKTIDEVYTYYAFDFKYVSIQKQGLRGSGSVYESELYDSGKKFNILSNGSSHAILNGDELYIDEKNLKSKIDIATITIDGNSILYGINTISADDYINLNRNKREPIPIKVKKIEGLKR